MSVIVATLVVLGGAVAFFSQPQKEVVVSADVLGAWSTGPTTPKVTLVEFSDFECPACGAAYPVVKQVVEKYKDDLKFVYRHFPLDQHKNARRAAEAAEAAGAQGKFWEMHDLLFANQKDLSDETIQKLASDLKLDMSQFNQDLATGKYKDKVQKDLTDGTAIGVNATPTFYLNGKKLSLFSFTDLDAEVAKALK